MNEDKTQELTNIDLVSVSSDYGHGANDGAYYPIGLLTIASHLRRTFRSKKINIIDMHHTQDYVPKADVVGISASSTLCYQNVLAVAEQAKSAGAIVVLGGPHATHLANQILTNRKEVIDFIIRQDGEEPLASLLKVIDDGDSFCSIPNLSWRNRQGEIIHNPIHCETWAYDNYLPFDFSTLSAGIKPYWDVTKERVQKDMAAGFVVFTHFGCGYRERMKNRSLRKDMLSMSCSYCSLGGDVVARKAESIVVEVLDLIQSHRVPAGGKVLLKCYGDNVGYHRNMISAIANAIAREPRWSEYDIEWTFYMQSSLLTEKMADILLSIGTKRLFIGFDSVDDRVQRLNGLGTNLSSHQHAVNVCRDSGLKIHGGFVLGCAGETVFSVEKSIGFAEEAAAAGVLERINAAIMVIMPGAPAYNLLCRKEPWVRELDLLDTEEIRWYWLRHFCPDLKATPTQSRRFLQDAADRLDDLCAGAHASMGFVSNRMLRGSSRRAA